VQERARCGGAAEAARIATRNPKAARERAGAEFNGAVVALLFRRESE
jgi:hypothetical protein